MGGGVREITESKSQSGPQARPTTKRPPPPLPQGTANWNELTDGDVLRHRGNGEAYIIVRSDWPDATAESSGDAQHTVVRACLATNPHEWEIVGR